MALFATDYSDFGPIYNAVMLWRLSAGLSGLALVLLIAQPTSNLSTWAATGAGIASLLAAIPGAMIPQHLGQPPSWNALVKAGAPLFVSLAILAWNAYRFRLLQTLKRDLAASERPRIDRNVAEGPTNEKRSSDRC